MRRRQFLKTMSGACLSLPFLQPVIASAISSTSGLEPALEEITLSLCNICPNNCSIRARKVAGRAVGISGNPLYPANRGHICSRGATLLDELNHPDRILQPLTRSGERGSGKFEPITWEEALDQITAQLSATRQRGAEKLVLLRHNHRDSLDTLISRFLKAYGTPNDICLNSGLPENPAISLMQGINQSESYDIENANYVLCFGADLLGSGPAPVYFNGIFGRFRRGKAEKRGRWIQIETQQTLTGNRADQWIQIRPGTEGALAMGIAYILIKRGFYDADFINRQCFGFDDWTDENGDLHQGFKSIVLQDYNVYKVSTITEVPVTTIDQLAYDFASRKPSLAIPGGDFSETNSATYTCMAVHALNALVGSIDRPGGVLFQRPLSFTQFPDLTADTAARSGLRKPRIDGAGSVLSPLADNTPGLLPENLLLGKPYRPELLMVFSGNPLYNIPEADKIKEALLQIPQIVSCATILDETSAWADIVLPTTNLLEEWGDGITPGSGAFLRTYGLRKPVTEPAGQARSPGDIVLALSTKLGGPCAQALPWKNYQAYLKESAKGIYQSGTGYIVNGSFDASWLTTLQKMGWRDPGYQSFSEFWSQLEEKGGWWDPVYPHGRWHEIFKAPSGKFEFFSLTLFQSRKKFEPEFKQADPSTDLFCLPHYEEPIFKGDERDFPYTLLVYESQKMRGDTGASLAKVQELPDTPHQDIWDTSVEISEEVAAHHHLQEGDMAWLETPIGRVKLPIRIYAGASKWSIAIAAGGGHTQLGRWAKGIGVNPHQLRAAMIDPISGATAWTCTRARIYSA